MPAVRVGRILGTFGVKGDVKLAVTTDRPERIGERDVYYLYDPQSGECAACRPLDIRISGGTCLVRFAGYDAPEPLKPFTSWELIYFIPRGALPREPGDVYSFELVGLEVRRAGGGKLGRVVDVIDSGAHTLLEVSALPGRLIPFTSQYVPEVNLERGYLVSSYPLDDYVEEG